MVIEGKYCQVSVVLSDLVNFGNNNELKILNKADDSIKDAIYLNERIRKNFEALDGTDTKKTLR